MSKQETLNLNFTELLFQDDLREVYKEIFELLIKINLAENGEHYLLNHKDFKITSPKDFCQIIEEHYDLILVKNAFKKFIDLGFIYKNKNDYFLDKWLILGI